MPSDSSLEGNVLVSCKKLTSAKVLRFFSTDILGILEKLIILLDIQALNAERGRGDGLGPNGVNFKDLVFNLGLQRLLYEIHDEFFRKSEHFEVGLGVLCSRNEDESKEFEVLRHVDLEGLEIQSLYVFD